jgi:hypothetical protein
MKEEKAVACFKILSSIYPEKLGESTSSLNKDSRPSVRESNPEPSE